MHKLRALLIAPPGAGKGTQASRICAFFEVTPISTGDLFRAAVASGSDLGKEVAAILDAGDLVSDEIVGFVVRDAVMRAIKTTGGYLLDGFPRTLAQAEAAHALALEIGITAQTVLTFDVPRAVLLERLMARGSAHGRTDDAERVIRHRLDVYDRQTAPLLDYYERLGMLVRVDADKPVDDVTATSIAVLEARLAVHQDAT